MRWIVLLLFVASAVYVHLRGRVRHGVCRQLSDHATFTAPLNCFCYLFSAVPTTPVRQAAQGVEPHRLLRLQMEPVRGAGVRPVLALTSAGGSCHTPVTCPCV